MEKQVLLELKNIKKSFGGIQAVEDLSFRVYSGEIQAIIGPNGAGKTTVFSYDNRLLRPLFRRDYISG